MSLGSQFRNGLGDYTVPSSFKVQPTRPHPPVPSAPQVLNDSALQRGSPGKLPQFLRTVAAEDEMKDGVIIIAGSWHKLEPPPESHDVRVRRQVLRQLLVQQPGRAGRDAQ